MGSILSKDEIQSLLRSGEQDATSRTIRSFDLASREKTSVQRLPGLEHVMRQFASESTPVFSRQLGSLCKPRLQSMEALTLRAWQDKYSRRGLMHKVLASPLPGVLWLGISGDALARICEQAFGGNSSTPAGPHRVTALQTRISRTVIAHVLPALKKSWESLAAVEFTYAGVETFEQVAGSGAEMVHGISVALAPGEEALQFFLCIPAGTIAPLREVLARGERTAAGNSHAAKAALREHVQHIFAEASVEIGFFETTPRRLSQLKTGDFLPMNRHPGAEAVLRIEGTPTHRGTLADAQGAKTMLIAGPIPAAERSLFDRTERL